MGGLRRGSATAGDAALAWAAGPRAPLDVLADGEGLTAVWGEAIDDAGRPLGAAELRPRWTTPGQSVNALDGFHVACHYDRAHGVIASADLLGAYPVYHWQDREVVLVSSTPAVFPYHPSFRVELDRRGLAGLLCTMHPVGGRTLLSGVRRLAPAHRLQSQPGGQAVEAPEWEVGPSTRDGDGQRLEAAMDSAISKRARRSGGVGMLLSGGLDSRLLAGMLVEQGADVQALSLGRPDDFDVALARRIARALGIPHSVRPDRDFDRPRMAWLAARWEHGAGGYNTILAWGNLEHLRFLPARVLTGYVCDSVVGGSHVDWGHSWERPEGSFDGLLARVNAWGVPLDDLRRLTGDEPVAEAVADLRAAYDSYGGDARERVWRFDLEHRQRFHVGGMLWRYAFSGWPMQPVLDREVIGAAAAIPKQFLANRKIQEELLIRRFPRLAAIPLDRNDNDPRPLRPTLSWSLERRWRRLRHGGARVDRRRYHRLLDFNSPQWVAVRRAAEPHREVSHEWLDPDVLRRLLPPPDEHVPAADQIVGTSGAKALTGFLIWCGLIQEPFTRRPNSCYAED